MDQLLIAIDKDGRGKSNEQRLEVLLNMAQTALDKGFNHISVTLGNMILHGLNFGLDRLVDTQSKSGNVNNVPPEWNKFVMQIPREPGVLPRERGYLLEDTKGEKLTDEERKILLKTLQMMSISVYYTDRRMLGIKITDALLFLKDTMGVIDKGMVFKNQIFYIKALTFDRKIKVPAKLPLINSNTEECYRPMNPSIINYFHTKGKGPAGSTTIIDGKANGYLAICRSVNYDQEKAKNWHILDPDNIVRTRNFLVELDSKFKPIRQREIFDKSGLKLFPAHVQGMEDCQLIKFRGQLWFLCTMLEIEEKHICRMVIGHLTLQEDRVIVDKLIPLDGPDPNRHEKNWLPFVTKSISVPIEEPKVEDSTGVNGDFDVGGSKLDESPTGWNPVIMPMNSDETSEESRDEEIIKATDVTIGPEGVLSKTLTEYIWVLYGYDPVEFYQIEMNADGIPTGKTKIVSRQPTLSDFSLFRGSGGPIAIKNSVTSQDSYLVVIHQAVLRGDEGRYYIHRWVELDTNWKIIQISGPLYFDHLGIEFCRSMTLSLDRKSVILGTGLEDREAYFYQIKLKTVLNILHPPVSI